MRIKAAKQIKFSTAHALVAIRLFDHQKIMTDSRALRAGISFKSPNRVSSGAPLATVYFGPQLVSRSCIKHAVSSKCPACCFAEVNAVSFTCGVGALNFNCPCGTKLRLPRSEEFWQCHMCYNLNQKKVHCTMCGCAKPSEEDDAALGKLQGTVEQKHNLRRAQAARNMKQQWKRYVSDSKLRWYAVNAAQSRACLFGSRPLLPVSSRCNLQMKWNTPHHIDEAFAATLGVKKLKDLLIQLDCTMLGGRSRA